MEFLRSLKDPELFQNWIAGQGHWISWGIYALLFAIIFSETGLLIGFFLPGDSLLFVAGAVAAMRPDLINAPLLMLLLCVAAITGDATGYLIGRRSGPKLFARPDSRFFKREHLTKTQDFYDKHGPKTIVLARFMPIIRTFAPMVAGVAGMEYRKFVLFNIAGGIGWIVSMVLAGYFLGSIPIVKHNFEKAVIGIIFLSILPMILHFVQEKRRGKSEKAAAMAAVAPGLENVVEE